MSDSETPQALEPVEVTLDPCPFCGEAAIPPTFDEDYNVFIVGCSSCAAIMHHDTPSRAIAAWNTRPSTTLLQEARDALDFALDEYECTHGKPRGFYASTHWTHHAREVLTKLDVALGRGK